MCVCVAVGLCVCDTGNVCGGCSVSVESDGNVGV